MSDRSEIVHFTGGPLDGEDIHLPSGRSQFVHIGHCWRDSGMVTADGTRVFAYVGEAVTLSGGKVTEVTLKKPPMVTFWEKEVKPPTSEQMAELRERVSFTARVVEVIPNDTTWSVAVEYTKPEGVTMNETLLTLCRWMCELHEFKWPDDYPRPRYRYWDRLPGFTIDEYADSRAKRVQEAWNNLMRIVTADVFLRYWNTVHRQDAGRMTDGQFDAWIAVPENLDECWSMFDRRRDGTTYGDWNLTPVEVTGGEGDDLAAPSDVEPQPDETWRNRPPLL